MRVLVTGAAGGVGQLLLPGLIGKYELTLTDRVPIPNSPGARTMLGDLTDGEFASEATRDVDAIVHLAANPDPEATWPELLGPNVQLVTRLLDASVANGVGKLVLASSAHAMGQYLQRPDRPINPEWTAAPCCRYGTSKVFTETIARSYSYRYGVSATCLRLGATFEKPWNTGMLGGWFAPADLRQLVGCCLDSDIRFGIYHGISANTRSDWDIDNARTELGYDPQCDSEIFATTVPDGEGGGLCEPYRN